LGVNLLRDIDELLGGEINPTDYVADECTLAATVETSEGNVITRSYYQVRVVKPTVLAEQQ